MNSRELLQQIQAIFALDASDMSRIFGLGGSTVSAKQILALDTTGDLSETSDWCSDEICIRFLNGLIIEARGPSDHGDPPVESSLTNNLIFRKLKIALNLQAADLIAMLSDTGVTLSKHELSALFRKSDNKHYRECSDELLASFFESLRINQIID